MALLGESTLFGLGLPLEETCGAQLMQQLGDSWEVLAAGVIGYTVHQGRSRYQELVRDQGVHVVVIAFGLIDESNPSPSTDDVERLAAARHRHSSWGRAQVWAYRNLLSVNWLQALGSKHRREQSQARDEQRNQLFRSSGNLDWTGLRRSTPEQYRECLERLVAEVRADGARPILVRLPGRPDVLAERPVLGLYAAAMAEVAASSGTQLIDLARVLSVKRPNGEPMVLSMLRSGDRWHLNAAGHQRLASAIAQHIRSPRAGL